jgi:hypothetical protein
MVMCFDFDLAEVRTILGVMPRHTIGVCPRTLHRSNRIHLTDDGPSAH